MKVIKAIMDFPFVQISYGEGNILLSWKAWHLAVYFFCWWNYS